MSRRPTRTRGPVEVKHRPERTVAAALAHVLRSPRPMTWGRIEVRHGAVRWDCDVNGFVWFIYTGEFTRLSREVHAACVALGWGDTGSECFARLVSGVGLRACKAVATT